MSKENSGAKTTRTRPVKMGGRVMALNAKNEVLLVTHNPAAFWYTPGGHTDPGESLEDCARRELFEETGLSAEVGRLIFVEEGIDPELDEHKIEFYFLVYTDAQNLPQEWSDQGGPVMQARFFSREELKTLPEVFPTTLRDTFWQLLESNFSSYNPYRNLLK
jgi:8-oxo-dGTP pyrophosphatase MutT (NUDIX family)